MSTVPVHRARVKPIRTANLTPLMSSGEHILTLTDGVGEQAKRAHYHLSCQRCDFGRGFRLEKLSLQGSTVYHVCLATDGKHTCDCLGHLRWGHRTICKHIASITTLTEQGRI